MSLLPWLTGLSMMLLASSMTFYEDNPVYRGSLADSAGWDNASPASAGLNEARLESGAQHLSQLPQIRSFLVAHEGRIVFERYFHGANAQDSYNVHSASKTLLGALVGVAIQHGFLKLDDRLGDLLASKYSVPKSKRDITVRHLLSMTSGIRWTEDASEYELQKTADWGKAILALPQAATPGRRFNYSTANTHLLSVVLTEVTGMPLDDFAEHYVYGPAGITVEHWGHDPQGYRSGGYNFYITPRELLKMGRIFLDGGQWSGKELLPPSWVAQSWKRASGDDDSDYGFLWWLADIRGHAVKKMWGYGGQLAYVIPDRGLVVVITADTRKEYDELDGDAFLAKYVLKSGAQGRRPAEK